jgi:hypothetical protein
MPYRTVGPKLPVRTNIMRRIIADELRVHINAAGEPEVWVFHHGRRRFALKKPRRHPKSGRANYNFDNQTIYRNVLVWMWVHRREPAGNDRVDHADGNRFNDHPDNLRRHSRYESDRQGYDVQTEPAFVACMAYFGYIAFWGDEPPDDKELNPDWARYPEAATWLGNPPRTNAHI